MRVALHVTSGTVETIIRSATHYDISVGTAGSPHTLPVSVHVNRDYFCLFELGGETFRFDDKEPIAMCRDDAVTLVWYQRSDGMRMVEALENHSRGICRVPQAHLGQILFWAGFATIVLLVVATITQMWVIVAAGLPALAALAYRECNAVRSYSHKVNSLLREPPKAQHTAATSASALKTSVSR